MDSYMSVAEMQLPLYTVAQAKKSPGREGSHGHGADRSCGLGRLGHIEKFESGLRGRILRAGDADYDVARRHYNALINKHPALIVQCAGVADVIDAVDFARTHRVLVAVRGGRPNAAGRRLVHGGMG